MKYEANFLILADGRSEFLQKDYLESLLLEKIFIALDGACEIARKWSIVPDVALGDMDSVSQETLTFLEKSGTKIIYTPDQNFSDLEKGIVYCQRNFAKTITIINACHGRFDHFIANLFFLKKYHNRQCSMKILDSHSCIFYVENERIELSSKIGAKCGFFGLPHCTLSTKGLKYELQNNQLTIGQYESIANEFLSEIVQCDISGNCLITYEI